MIPARSVSPSRTLPPALVPYDLPTAKRLLAEAGYPDGKGFPALELTTISSEINQRIAEAIQQMWRRDLGIEIRITQKEFKVLLDAFDTLDYTIARGRWIAEFPDPLTYLNMLTTGNGVNGTGFADPGPDGRQTDRVRLLRVARREMKPREIGIQAGVTGRQRWSTPGWSTS